MNITALRDTVQRAHQQDQQQLLRQWLAERLPSLHSSIVPPSDGVDGLLHFVEAYIQEVPDVLEAAQSVARQANLETLLLPVLRVAADFFLQPPELPAEHQGLLALLDEAYLAHRLVEEINDRYANHGGTPLIPLDTTRANLIVHHLLGEPFANQLDSAVEEAVTGLLPASLFASEEFQQHLNQLDASQRQQLWDQWPCLSSRLGMDIRLAGG
ncbi:hypothetical protein [Halopseudomonas salegens]|uniref:Uncharacterized protein n=1 Tax=Halopseudomonas salegens TaxID=1434072 RepID=A0A1H2HZC9_9GAMM|nr:hypothetical protein [Halopseudomonas salegens]SDU37076.1 hypothetical protein SAMN05216210_3422 [Halopseudomonas salegens]